MRLIPWFVFAAAAVLEVGGDASIRHGLRGRSTSWILLGCAVLASYGLVVNSLRWDFSRLLGVYVGFFAAASVLIGRVAFHEQIPCTTWCGLALILLGGLIIQLGR
jgi:small multidrug resistance family-3 protein